MAGDLTVTHCHMSPVRYPIYLTCIPVLSCLLALEVCALALEVCALALVMVVVSVGEGNVAARDR